MRAVRALAGPVALGLPLVVALAAQGYILPGGSILRRMVAARDEQQLVTLKIDGNVSFYGEAAKQGGAALGLPADRGDVQSEAAIYLRFPGRCRLEATSIETQKLAAAVHTSAKRRVEGGEVQALAVAVSQLCPLLAFRSSSDGEGREAVNRQLAALKIESRKTSLARIGGQVAYVLGDPAEGSPQFWIYKDNFLPARLRFTDPAGVAWDLRFLDYASPATGEWFPRVVELFKGAEPVLKFTGLKGDAKSKIDEKLF